MTNTPVFISLERFIKVVGKLYRQIKGPQADSEGEQAAIDWVLKELDK